MSVLNRVFDVGARWLGTYVRLHFFRSPKGEVTLTISRNLHPSWLADAQPARLQRCPD